MAPIASPARSQGKENLIQARNLASTRKTCQSPAKNESLSDAPVYLPPSTPAVRLPLADLLGDNEETAKNVEHKEDSPELNWISNSQHPDFTPGKRRKRAHSSSPASSSQNESSSHFLPRAPLNLQEIQRALKTPKADPAADLWTRYNGSNPVEEQATAELPSLTRLLQGSSPQSLPRTPGGSIGGLRRWASCGNEWPASRPKRRKTSSIFRDQGEEVRVERETSNGSRLGAMVDQVQANLVRQKQTERINEPSSSSPLPDKGSFDNLADRSPVGQSRARHEHELERRNTSTPHDKVSDQGGVEEAADGSSDYGDDNIDLTELAMDDTEFPKEDSRHDTRTNREGEARYQQGPDPVDSMAASGGRALRPVGQLQTIDEESDEFGDDDELTAQDLEIAFTQIETLTTQRNTPSILGTGRCHQNNQHDSASNKVQPPGTQYNIGDDEDDEFGGLDADEESFAAAEIAATQAYRASGRSQASTIPIKSRKIQRYLIQKVVTGQYLDHRGFQQEEKVLIVEEEKNKFIKAITLRQSWLDTSCKPGAYVHIVGSFSKTGQITIDDAANLIIVHPDHLVSATAVADSFDCLRKAVLQDRVKATSVTSKPTVYGSILHELFQKAMQSNRWDIDWLHQLINDLVVKYVEGLFEAGAKDTVEAVEFLTSKMPELRDWAGHFVRSSPSRTVKAQDRNGKTVGLSVTKLLDVEEHVWSPTYGLKGNIDATVEVTIEDEEGRRNLTVPFEVKTGKYQSAAHRAQTALYTLLLSDRYDVNVQYGVLYYMDNSAVSRIPAIRNELRHMVMQRNELASYVRERLSLPPMLKNEFKCGRCYAKTSCFLYHKLSEDGTPETAGVGTKFAQVVSKLRRSHQDFFKKWDDLLTKEETEMFKFRRELWTMLSHEREKLGRCFSEVTIEQGTAREDHDAQKINRFSYSFLKKKPAAGFSFTDSQIAVGEPIVVSSEQGHFALANGYVTKVSASRISVAVDRRLHNARIRQKNFDEETNQSFTAIMEVGVANVLSTAFKDAEEGHQVVYRLDKDEFSNGMATVRNNLLAIMDDGVFRSYELRELIIEDKAPVFKPAPTAYTLSGPPSQMQINSDQRSAIDKIMSAQDYALVLGMPGTGKTTTIAHIIRALVARGKSVLLTSYTHTAVDNILLKLRDDSISVLRLGVQAKIHPEVQEFAKLACMPPQSIPELEEMYLSPSVVATTCLGVNHQLFHKRIFDYCIVDEASQITLPVCLGPIRMARTFVLVGDHFQLPPLVQNKEAQEGGLDISLFKLLSDRRPESVANLEHQYRMAEEIMHLSNTLIYGGRLKCGNDAVAKRTLVVPQPTALSRFHDQTLSSNQTSPTLHTPPLRCSLRDLLSPDRKVVFANTDALSHAHESLAGSRITNPYEASVLHLIASALLAQGINPTQIGIITFYRSQLSLLRQMVKGTPADGIEMHTADKFQGRDKEVVLLSCVRSNKDGNVGELLRDWRRVNVAVTRARSKFVVVGSRKTLSGDELWRKLIGTVQESGGIVDLDERFIGDHVMPDREVGSGAYGEVARAKEPDVRKVLAETKALGNRGRNAMKQGKIGRELLLKRRPVSQDIMNMIME
ncbi:DNA replication ATP-dependent helicase/nuclease dna2 [Sphaceloma murrayae]|uniref:DNA replication ATP-dependent helicase/nuclease n=1 Tax=Sphaceloma murrayae TaxID=2082308 RepID=A0A2K1QY07_9PEZI|nr:DNA replication ATP-dependent helicase/nuclease dna2 [Sphaceloma murrayae]